MDKNLTVLQDSLSRLNTIYAELKSLDQWKRLRQDEFSRQPFCNIRFSDKTSQELSNLYCDFLFAAQQSFNVLNSIKNPSDKIIQIKKQINTICCRIYYFGSGINFY